MNSSNTAAGKSLPTTPSYPVQAQTGTIASSLESPRRSGQLGLAVSQPTPRKGQALRKQHKNQRLPGALQISQDNPDEYDSVAELRAVRNPLSRRGQTSITHLLDYTSSRSFQDRGYHPRSHRRNPAWGVGSGHHAADKSRYVHSNYRFVVSPEGHYKSHQADADVFLDWGNVLQIIASSESQAASCPICLSEPVAPRMAKCGHIFCLPCLIRFMNSSSEDDAQSGKTSRWKKCPICEDAVYLQDVRPVRFYAGQESPLPRVGDDVVLRLMARKATSTLALPRDGRAEVLSSGDEIPWHYAANVLDYSRIMKGTSEYMANQFEEEVVALMQQEKEDEALFGASCEWTQKAVRTIRAMREKTDALQSPVSMDSARLAAEAPGRLSSSSSSSSSSGADFYFYSAPPHLYLSPLDIRILKAKYGVFSAFPSTLLPRVEHISTGHVVDDVLRKRAKYLGHLPHGCIISFLECDWTDIVPAEILETFSAEIEQRRKRNREKAAQEERERLQSERLEAAALRGAIGVHNRRHPALEMLEEDRTPVLDLSQFQPLTSSHSGTTPPGARSGFETLATMSTSPSTQRTIWGTKIIPASPDLEPIRSAADDGWLKDEDFVGTDDLAMQIEAIEAMGSNDKSVASAGASVEVGNTMTSGGGKKKKKKQKITLMSTGGRRGN